MTKFPTQVCTLREANFEDCETATELIRTLGLIIPEGQDEIRHHWRRFWIDNPALNVNGPNLAKGWLLENNGRTVGFFGNIPLLYDYGGQPIIVANASQWGVEKEFRNETQRLADSYFKQKNADLLLVTTGIKPTGRIFEHYGGLAVPQPNYDQILYWVLNAQGFMKAGLMQKGFHKKFASTLAQTGGLVASAAITLSGHRTYGNSGNIDTLKIDDIGDDFNDLWRRKRDEAECLLACRTAECLRWHFGTKSMSARTRLLISQNANQLAGYAIVMLEDLPEIELKRLKIVDLFVAGNDGIVINDLLTAAYELGLREGCHVLELIGLPDHLRQQIILRHRPRLRSMPTYPLYYKNLKNNLESALLDESSWYVTAYDGDTAIF